jgi:glucose/arabinose dehydrogenase
LTLLLPLTSFGQGLMPQRVDLARGKSITLKVPEDMEIVPALQGLKRVRFFARSPDGRIFVSDMHDLTDNRRGAVYILDGWNPDTGHFARAIPYMKDLRNPNSLQFFRDASGQDWLYLAETDKLTRRRYTAGETRPTDTDPRVLATFPAYGLSYKYGGWHLTRTIAFSPAGKLYISVGSSCNACVEKEKMRASVIEMDPDGSNQREFCRGLRNAVGLKWIGNALWASGQGVDHLGLQKPDETFYALRDGADYGWPYCYSAGGRVAVDKKFSRREGCRNVPAPDAYFPVHASALGFDMWDEPDAPDAMRNAFVVALHGSTNKSVGHGYKIVAMRKGERVADLITGFLQGGRVVGRPCDVLKLDAGAFLFTDDHSGIVYLVRRKGTSPGIAIGREPAGKTPEASPPGNPSSNTSPTCLSLIVAAAAIVIRTMT